MPELPEVETVRLDCQAQIQGLKIDKVQVYNSKTIQGIPADEFILKVEGSRINKIGRRGKILLFGLSNGYTMLIHLKMTGQLTVKNPSDPLETWTHVIFFLSDGDQLRFRDQRKFGYIRLVKTDRLAKSTALVDLGPEPLSSDFSLELFKDRLARRQNAQLKSLLLDQRFLVGIGNIYSDEILFESHLKPTRRVNTLNNGEVSALFKAIKTILDDAIRLRGSSFSQFVDLAGKPGDFVQHHKVYRREGLSCLRDDRGVIKKTKISGRSSCYCPSCQH